MQTFNYHRLHCPEGAASRRSSRIFLPLLCFFLSAAYIQAQCTLTFNNCPEQPIILTDCNHDGQESLSWPDIRANAMGPCSDYSLVQHIGPLPGTVVPVGVHHIGYMAQSNSLGEGGPLQATCEFDVIVLPDVQPPVFQFCPPDITVIAGSPAFWPEPTVSDNCSEGLETTGNFPCGEIFPPGTHSVTYTATDASGNVTTCQFTVTVQEGQPPVTEGSRPGASHPVQQSGFKAIPGPSLRLFPNPFQDEINLQSASVLTSDRYIQIIDMHGRRVMDAQWPAGTSQFRLASERLIPGVYLIRMEAAENGEAITLRGIKG